MPVQKRLEKYWRHRVHPLYLISEIIRLYASSWVFCSLVDLFKFFPRLLQSGPVYFTRGTAQVFFTLNRFLLDSLVSISFLVLLRYHFLIFYIVYKISYSIIIKLNLVFHLFWYYRFFLYEVLSWVDSYHILIKVLNHFYQYINLCGLFSTKIFLLEGQQW